MGLAAVGGTITGADGFLLRQEYAARRTGNHPFGTSGHGSGRPSRRATDQQVHTDGQQNQQKPLDHGMPDANAQRIHRHGDPQHPRRCKRLSAILNAILRNPCLMHGRARSPGRPPRAFRYHASDGPADALRGESGRDGRRTGSGNDGARSTSRSAAPRRRPAGRTHFR